MRCPNCQRRNPDNYLYCAYCGAPLGTAGGEWRFATVVFFDLSNFTRFTREEGAEVAWQEAERAFAIVRDAVEREGGEVHKTYGDGLVAVFGLGRSRGAEAEGALRAAAATVAEVEARYREGRLRLEGRAAVTSGLLLAMPTRSGRELFGDPLNRAQRLVALTPPGVVYLDETTRTMVKNAETQPLPPLTAKGFPKPLKAFRLVGFTREHARTHEDALLAELERLWSEVQAGRGRVAVLVGPPGSGKRLVAQAFLERLKPGRVLRLPPLVPGVSLRGWIRGYLEQNPEVKRRVFELELPPEVRRRAEIAFGFRPGRVREEGGVEAVAEVVRRLAQEPWVILIEGLHRAPPLLLRFLEHWHGAEGSVLVLGTARSGSYPARFELRRLDPEKAERWLAERFPESDPEKRRRAAELADGLPGLMAQLVPWPEEERLLAALQPHFDALGEAREALLLAASLAEPVPPERLAAVLGPRVEAHLARLKEEGFLTEAEGGLVFTSRAYRRAAAASVPGARRRAWLRALAEALLERGAGEEAVRCYLEAGLKGPAIRVLRVLARAAPENEALSLLERARTLAETREQEAAVRLDLAERWLAKDPKQALAALGDLPGPRARRLKGLALAALGRNEEAARHLAAYLDERPEDREAWRRFLELAPIPALLEAKPPEDPGLLRILARRLETEGRLGEAAEAYRRALAHSQGDAAAELALALAGLAWRAFHPRDARTYAQKALAEAQDPATATLARAILGSLELDVGNLVGARSWIEEARSALEDLPCGEAYARVAGIELRLLIESGRLERAERQAEEYLARCNHPWIGAMAALIAALRGDDRRAHALVQRLLPRADSLHTTGFLLLAMGIARAKRGEDPRPDYRAVLRLSARAKNPYLRFLALAAFALYYRPQAPAKTKAIADRMLKQTWRQGFLPFHHLARLLKAEAAHASGRRVAPLLRFESPFLVLEYWRRSLLLAEGHEVEPVPEERLLGYGILGRLALASWKRVWTREKRSARESA